MRKVIYFDGSCGLCCVLKDKLESSSQKDKFINIDITRDQPLHNFSKSHLMQRIHLVDEKGKTYHDIDAIFKVLEVFPKFKFLVKIGRVIIIKQLLSILYKFVSSNRHYLYGKLSRIYWLKIILSLGLLSGFLLSFKLWISTRSYPLSPVLDIFPKIIFPFDYALFFLTLINLILIIILPRPRLFIFSFVLFAVLLSLLDQSRWQAWFYQYIFMFIYLGYYSWKDLLVNNIDRALSACQLIVASVYFWSGINKLNPNFSDTYHWIVTPLNKVIPEVADKLPKELWMGIPIFEALIGILLLTRFKNIALWGAIMMHLFLLFALGPFGLNFNSIIWPWNITMILLVIVLFWGSKNFSMKELLFYIPILVLLGIMPIFRTVDLWDTYLSFNLYSNNTNYAGIYVHKSLENKLPSEIEKWVPRNKNKRYPYNYLSLHNWSFSELNVPVYPEKRIFKNITQHLCQHAQKPSDIVLQITERKNILLKSPKISRYNCSELQNF